MCGIFLYIGSDQIKGKQKICLCSLSDKLIHRGPDQKQVRYYSDNVMMGFHRLAIVDPTPNGIQPFESNDGRFVCIANGEIYNYKQIKEYLQENEYHVNWKTHSDCEVIVHLFDHLVKIEYFQPLEHPIHLLCRDFLDGEYAMVIYDNKTARVYYATDELSMRPLFIGQSNSSELTGYFIASEQKAMAPYCDKITRIEASSYGWIDFHENETPDKITVDKITTKLYFNLSKVEIIHTSFDKAVLKLRELLIENVIKKLNPDREYVFLLSGGVDSSLICAIAARELSPIRIRTFTIGFSANATDILAARKVAAHIDSIHTEFICNYQEGIDMIPFVIYHNESWDQTTTRASIPMSLCVKKIKEKHPDVAVIFSGEVADEMLRGYLYNRNTPSLEAGRADQIMRLKNIHTSDGIRADRVCASHSTECRFPFFSKDLVKFSVSLPPDYLDPAHNEGIEKYILRLAFDKKTGDRHEYLPHDILWRTKNAMSDATSVKSGWKDHLKSFCDNQISDSRFSKREHLYPYCTPQTKEDMYYREIFDEYGYDPTTIPFKWMSSWCDPRSTDSSASTLDVFEEDQITVNQIVWQYN